MAEDARRGWRRVVPSPYPREIVEFEAIRSLVADGFIVVACGGGGIPVTRADGSLCGLRAVIDKDLTASLLARKLGADLLLISTAVDRIALGLRHPRAALAGPHLGRGSRGVSRSGRVRRRAAWSRRCGPCSSTCAAADAARSSPTPTTSPQRSAGVRGRRSRRRGSTGSRRGPGRQRSSRGRRSITALRPPPPAPAENRVGDAVALPALDATSCLAQDGVEKLERFMWRSLGRGGWTCYTFRISSRR